MNEERGADGGPERRSVGNCPASTPTACQLLIDGPASGAWNMAVDEMLWQEAAEQGGCVWRFYRWSEPTLSLGYFQRYEDRFAHLASRDCACVRRLSGGGAIMHDDELTYSVVLPARHRLARDRLLLYRAIHGALIESLAGFGVDASLCDPLSATREEPRETIAQPFLCFQRRSDGDVLADRVKVAGSAQRRSRGAVLQHGSVLLRRSAAAPELDSLADLVAKSPDCEQLISAWSPRLAERLGFAFEPRPLSGNQRAKAADLSDNKYVTDRWTKDRGR